MNLMRFHVYAVTVEPRNPVREHFHQIGRLYLSTDDEAVARAVAVNRTDLVLVDTHEE